MSAINDALEWRLSGGASNSNVNAALGGAKSSVSIVNSADHNLFAKVADAEVSAGSVKYRGFYLHNSAATALTELGLYLGSVTASPNTEVYIGIGSSGVNGVEQSIADEDAAPVGITFAHPTSEAAALGLPDIPAGQHIALWVRRNVTAGAQGAWDDYVRLIPVGVVS